jgi:hypothetical protein
MIVARIYPERVGQGGLIETNSPNAVHVYGHVHVHVNVDMDVDVFVHVDSLLILSNTNTGTAESFRVSPPEAVIDLNGIRSHFGVSAGGRFFPGLTSIFCSSRLGNKKRKQVDSWALWVCKNL